MQPPSRPERAPRAAAGARATTADESLGPLPRELADALRSELPGLGQEIAVEIKRTIPHYAVYFDGPYGRAVRLGVELSIASFVDRVYAPGASTARRDALCRRIARFEAYEGRTLDDLQTAFRVGARVALRRARALGRRHRLSPAVLLAFADALFGYVEELITVSREGYAEARAEMGGGQEGLRRRLLRLILAGPAVPHARLSQLAELARWPLPDEVTLVALSPHATPPRGVLGSDVLADLADPQPHVLVPGPVHEDRRAVLEAAPTDIRAAVGLTVPVAQAAQSLRWARQALTLVESGAIPKNPVTFCDDHLLTLWLTADTALTDQLARRQLAPLTELSDARRERLLETLRAWLATRGNAAQMAEVLHLHPQTVRYRLRLMERAFGHRLGDLSQRFATESVLRALELRGQPALPQQGGPRPHPGS
ncbi:helix-turn-helix domain-containing protein [Streptomyces sp. TRM 70351]|uniref:PucR family transcriptional regulator n=1 Tax=Streptomyces sp. TRM 70351 TaxID=3116552 RepID=UPI002E7BDDE6|nr:helix-turn-helix domain-containing protein [Streptomyces sp. TRM 70351]MEE1927062.1 helix-turn-helix domain-containing protein [Streptomyces sp. TRM 70351]